MEPHSTAATAADDHATASRLRELIMGFRNSQLLHVAAALDLADHLAPAAREPTQLATAIGVDPGALRRLLRALSALGLVAERDGMFALTTAGELR
jgi:hypothetical protein